VSTFGIPDSRASLTGPCLNSQTSLRASMDGSLKILGLVVVWCLWTSADASAVEPRPAARKPTLVISMAYREPNGLRRPVVEVWSSGEVRAIELRGTRKAPVEVPTLDRLSNAEYRELVTAITADWKLSELSTDQIQSALQKASDARQLTAEIPNAAQTELTIVQGGQELTLSCPAVSILATRFPEVAELQQIEEAQNRLLNIAAVALVGGSARADQLAETATQQLQESNSASVVTRQDLRMVRRLADGSRFVQFVTPAVPGQSDGCLVSLTQSPQGPTRVSVHETPEAIR